VGIVDRVGESRIRAELDEERVTALYGQLFPLLSNAGLAAIIAFAMNPVVGGGRAWIWLGLMVFVTACRAGVWALARQRREADLPSVVRTVVDDMVTHATPAPLIRLDLLEPLRGHWDVGRLEQVVRNLLENALRYGGGTPVDVRVGLGKEGDAVLSVADHGPGIAAAERAHVFERFYRAEVGSHPGGLGLGLAVVREIITAMGGVVSIDAEPAGGAVFSVRLPRTAPVAAPQPT
jgi:signal transduction histidine kinase